jgi:hypothetical protein
MMRAGSAERRHLAHEQLVRHIGNVGGIVREAHRDLSGKLVGLHAVLDKPGHRYHGRTGTVDGVMFDDDGVRLCLMIHRKGTTEILNGDADSRSYWPAAQVRLLREQLKMSR